MIPRENNLKLNALLHQAVINNELNTARSLLACGAKVDYTHDANITLLCLAARLLNGIDLFQLLLDCGADPNARDNKGRTPLHYACVNGNEQAVKVLLCDHYTVNVDALDISNCTPLYYAAREGHELIVEQLIRKECNVNLKMSPYTLRRFGQWLNEIHIIEDTPLIKAVKKNHIAIAQHLIQAGSDVNSQGTHNNTALHYAVNLQNTIIIKLLVQAKANVLIKNDRGHTPKDLAITEKKGKVLTYLSNNMQRQLKWSNQESHKAADLFILLKGEHRLILYLLSQMSRAQQNAVSCRQPYIVNDFSFMVLHIVYAIQQELNQALPILLPIEIWQRISAFWIQATLNLENPIDEINASIGVLFAQMNDFFISKRYAM